MDEQEIATWRQRARKGEGDAAIAAFRSFVEGCPEDPRAHYELACGLDYEGREEEAVAPYRRALVLGLPEPYLQGLLVGLGSTLRNVGKGDESVELLEDAVRRYPDFTDLRVFLALARYSVGHHGAALADALEVILAIPGVDLHGYDPAIQFYASELRTLDEFTEG